MLRDLSRRFRNAVKLTLEDHRAEFQPLMLSNASDQAIAEKLMEYFQQEHPALWEEIKRPLTIDFLTKLIDAEFQRNATKQDAQLPLPGFEGLPVLIPTGRRRWIKLENANYEQLQRFRDHYESRLTGEMKRSRIHLKMLAKIKRLTRIVAWYGRKDSTVTTEQALEKRKQFIEERRARKPTQT
jgi:hypothetical protein